MGKNELGRQIETYISSYMKDRKLPYRLERETEYFINGERERLYLCQTVGYEPEEPFCGEEKLRGRSIATSDLIKKYEKGMSMELIASKFLIEADQMREKETEDIEEYIDKIGAVLINMEKNREFLKHVPHRRFLDLALTYHVMLKNGEDIDLTAVTTDMMKRHGLTEKKLYERALRYTAERFKAKVTMEGRAIRLSNDIGRFGAIAMLDGELLESLSKEHDSDLVIIPTSIHEVHAFPAKKIYLSKVRGVMIGLSEMIEPEDFLSDNYYIYDAYSRKIELGICDRV